MKIISFLVFSPKSDTTNLLMENPNFPMQESPHMPPAFAENIPLQPEMDPSYPSVHGFPMDDNSTAAPLPARDRPTNRQPPVTYLEDLKGKVFSKAMEQHGCQLLLQKLQERKPEDIQMIFSEVKNYICKLMFNRFGSEIILKLFEVCDEEQKNQLVSSVTADARLLISVCLDPQGSESMQKFLGCPMTPKQIYHMMCVFSYFTVPLVNHRNGSRVIGHCFKIFPIPAKETEPILNVIDENCLEIAMDENGSSLLRALISGHSLKEGVLGCIVSKIISESYHLSEDQFGSCVVQDLIGLERPNLLESLVDELQGFFTVMSTDEYANIVVKKLVGASSGKHAHRIINEMLRSRHFLTVLVDPRGFSILKSAKSYTKGHVRKALDDRIRRHAPLLNKK